jgi:hypothetical protein
MESTSEGDYCIVHERLMCSSCGDKATHDCAETFGLVCGSPLCDECEHEINSEGCCDSRMIHIKKDKQVNLPWYMKEGI